MILIAGATSFVGRCLLRAGELAVRASFRLTVERNCGGRAGQGLLRRGLAW